MALQISKTFNNGITTKKTYLKIINLTGNKECLELSLAFYVNEECSIDKIPLDIKHYSFTPNVEDGSDNFIKQGYEYLKTLDEFSVAIDRLE